MFQARTALTELSFAATLGMRRGTVIADVKMVALERLAWKATGNLTGGQEIRRICSQKNQDS